MSEIRLRALELMDVDTLYEWENDTAAWQEGSTIAPFSRRQLMDYVTTYDGDIYSARQLRLMIAVEGHIGAVGAIDLYEFDPVNLRAGVGIYLSPEFRGAGYGRAALEELAAYCRDRLGMHQLWAIAGQDNHRSRALFEECGFTASGRLRSWLRRGTAYTDAYLYQRML